MMHEDVLQAIFLHYIGVKWSVFLKGAFRQFRKSDGVWKSSQKTIPQIDQKRREYYIGPDSTHRVNSVYLARDAMYRKHYFAANLMGHDEQQIASLEGEEEANYNPSSPTFSPPSPYPQQRTIKAKKAFGMAPMAMMQATAAIRAAPMSHAHNKAAYNSFRKQDGDSDSESQERRPMEDKQRLLRLLSAEVAIGTKIHSEVTAFHSVSESWNSLLPHESILTVVSLLGVSEAWIAFFNKFLRAPLKFPDDSPETAPRTRRRGTLSHVLSEAFSESIFFCLDFAVNQVTNGHNIHRMHDDFWFWSRDHDIAKTAWTAVSDFVNATRTYINLGKSGTVRISRDSSASLDIDQSLPVGNIRWGFLKLSTKTGKFEIDQAVVDKHIVDLRRQLADKRKSVISFIQI